MTPERWQQVKGVFEAACELSPGQRASYLESACADDPSLREEVESIIASSEQAPDFFEAPAFQRLAEHPLLGSDASLVGRQIGAYRLVRLIATGGMGAVYVAARADDQYHKNVAVKLIRHGMATRDVVRRFHDERQTLANLDHPNIARLLDGGLTDEGLPYLVMEYVDGTPIDRYCDEHNLHTTARLKLFCTVCTAVQYAHQNLVVHRDLKPSNVLVTGDGVPKLLDFGIAKMLSPEHPDRAVGVTVTGQRLMTPEYASPEQVRGEPVTTATDVYSLGVILYELLTGHRPYRLKSRVPHEIERTICEQEPEKPSTAIRRVEQVPADGPTPTVLTPEFVSRTRDGHPQKLRRRLSGDLDTIVLMAIRKDPARRYASAGQLSEDIRRHLDGRPVLACPDTFAYRAAKFVKRNKAVASIAAALVLALIAGIVGTSWQAHIAARERDRAVVAQGQAARQRDRALVAQDRAARERDRAVIAKGQAEQINRFLQDMLASVQPERQGRDVTVREVLDKAAGRLESESDVHPEVEAAIRATVGNTYARLGRYADAEPHLRAALEIRQKLLGAEHADVATSLNDLVWLLYAKGNYDEAEAAARQALAIRRNLPDPQPAEVATSFNNLAAILKAKGDLAAAEPLYREALAMRREALGDDHPDVAESLNNVAGVLRAKGDLDGAEVLLRQALEIRRRAWGDKRPEVAQSIDNLAVLLAGKGDYAAAEPLLHEALAMYRDLLGNDHPDVAVTLSSLASVRWLQGDYAGGEQPARESLEIRRKMLADNDPRTAYGAGLLGRCLLGLGRHDEAEPLLLEWYVTTRDLFGGSDPRTRPALESLIKLYDAWGKPDKLAQYRALLPDENDASTNPGHGDDASASDR